MSGFWTFANSWPLTALITIWILAWAFVQPFRYAFRAYARKCRSQNIQAQGWPTNPNMDADGDLVYPDKEEATS